MKIMQILEFHARITKNNQNHKFPRDNYENQKKLEFHERIMKLRKFIISLEHYENLENLEFQTRIRKS